MEHKLLMGYQGWFACPGDGSPINGYFHWFRDEHPTASSLRVDMWPDESELTAEERCATEMTYPDGRPASLYSGYNAKTVRRHFQWMSDYGVDGVFVQRFGSELTDPAHFATRNQVTNNARAGAEAYGRVFAMMYDTSGMHTDTFVQIIEDDWKFMVDEMKVTESPAYLQHHGQPVLAIWGLGFTEHPGTPAQAMELIDFFEHNPDPKYRATLVGGVPTYWNTLEGDSLTDPGWAEYYCGLDVISPWTVGRYTTDLDVDLYQRTMRRDMAAATTCGAEYMPVVHPGTSFHNSSGTPFNLIPRRGGNFYWRQVYNAVSIDVPMIYNAMFDEVDEGTAMFKVAATSADQPVGVDLIAMDADGYRLPSDWYLSLAGAASQMLRGEIPVVAKIPLAFEFPPPPIPTGLHRFRVQITTTSDYFDLTLLSGGALRDPALVSASPEATRVAVADNRIAVAQTLDRATGGGEVELVVDVLLSDLEAGAALHFLLESGALGSSTVTFFAFVDDAPVEVDRTTLDDTSKLFELPAEPFLA